MSEKTVKQSKNIIKIRVLLHYSKNSSKTINLLFIIYTLKSNTGHKIMAKPIGKLNWWVSGIIFKLTSFEIAKTSVCKVCQLNLGLNYAEYCQFYKFSSEKN